jgi:hypothetical protein
MFSRRRAGGRIGRGIVPQPKMPTGRLVRTYAGAREKSGGSSAAATSQAMGPVVAEVERAGELDGWEGRLRDHPRRASRRDARDLRSASPEALWRVEQLSGFAEPKLFERLTIDLPNPLTRHLERPPDLVQRPRMVAAEPLAQLEHAMAELLQRVSQRFVGEDLGGPLVGRLGALVNDELAELGLLLVADPGFSSETGVCAERLIDSTSSVDADVIPGL